MILIFVLETSRNVRLQTLVTVRISTVLHMQFVNNEEISTVENLKLLGVAMDSKLNITDHITSICTVLYILLYSLARLYLW